MLMEICTVIPQINEYGISSYFSDHIYGYFKVSELTQCEEELAAKQEERYKFHLQDAHFWKERTKSFEMSSNLQAQAAAGACAHSHTQ